MSLASSPLIQIPSPLTSSKSSEMLASKLPSSFPLSPSSSLPPPPFVPSVPFGPMFQYPPCCCALPGQEGPHHHHHYHQQQQHPKVLQGCGPNNNTSSSSGNVTQTAAAKRRNRRKRNMHRKIEYAQLVALTAASLLECSPAAVESRPLSANLLSNTNANNLFVHANHDQSNRNPFYNYHNASSTLKIKSCLRYVSSYIYLFPNFPTSRHH